MKIVIDIPEETYNEVCWRGLQLCPRGDKELVNAIKNGTPLPKNHGRLIDADSLIKTIEEKAKRLINADTINGLCGAVALIFDEQTIIKAEREETE